MSRHRRHPITDAVAGRHAGLVKAQLDQLVERTQTDAGDIAHAVQRAQQVTDAAWPPDIATDIQEGTQ